MDFYIFLITNPAFTYAFVAVISMIMGTIGQHYVIQHGKTEHVKWLRLINFFLVVDVTLIHYLCFNWSEPALIRAAFMLFLFLPASDYFFFRNSRLYDWFTEPKKDTSNEDITE